ncbi:MAG: SPFH domain-containing protein [Eggerthellaceae bacterium]|nr:SPFH domain-containing protein [Eggerthellaceae bacterium]
MGFFDKNTGGFMDEIRCDEQNYLIWKWHPKGTKPSSNKRENAVRWGSSLRVRDGSVAAFVYKQNNGAMQDFIEGPFDQIINTRNFPVLASIVGLAYDGGTPFQAEIYFINLARVLQVKFAVPFFDVYDPRFLDFGVPTAARGTITFRISDYREFVKLHRLDEFNLDAFKTQIKDAVTRYVKSAVANAPADFGIPAVQIERRIAEINAAVFPLLSQRLKENFGVDVSGVDIAAIEIDKASEGYQQLKAVTLDVSTQTVQAQAAVNIRNLEDQQRINAENMAETLRIQREEAQYAQHKTTQSGNFAAYQLETQGAIGIAGAQALGQMGEGGALGMGGNSGDGMNPAAMMAGMAMGGAIGQNMAGMMSNMMGGVQQQTPGTTPPPVPVVAYHVAVGGQPTGPYDLSALKQLVSSGVFTQDSLVWKEGMANWQKAGGVRELTQVFSSVPPEMPSSEIPPIPPQA